MAKLTWDTTTQYPEYGISHVVLYFRPGTAVPWNGVIEIRENLQPNSLEPIYFDGNVINLKRTPGVYKASITAYTYPTQLEDHIITQFGEEPFFLSSTSTQPVHMTYRTKTPKGDKLHMVYNCVIKPKQIQSSTLSDSPEVQPFVFDVVALPVSYGTNVYPYNSNRYDTPDPALLPPPPGSDPSAWEDYLKNRYTPENPAYDLPPFIYNPDLGNPEYPSFEDHLDLGNMFPSPHFEFPEWELSPGEWDNLLNGLYGTPDFEPDFPAPQILFDELLGPKPALPVDFDYTVDNSICSQRPIIIGYHDTAADGYEMPVPPEVMPGDLFVAAYTYIYSGTFYNITPGGDPIRIWGHHVQYGNTPWMGGYAAEPDDTPYFHDGRSSYTLESSARGLRIAYAWLPGTTRETSKGYTGTLIQHYEDDGTRFLSNTMSWNFNSTDAGLQDLDGSIDPIFYLDIPNYMWDDTDVDDFYIIRLGHFKDSTDLKAKPVCYIDSGRQNGRGSHTISGSSITLLDSRVNQSVAPPQFEYDAYWETMSYLIQMKCPS